MNMHELCTVCGKEKMLVLLQNGNISWAAEYVRWSGMGNGK